MTCHRCNCHADAGDILQGLFRPVLVDGVVHEICPACVKLILQEWVIAFARVEELK